MQLTRRGPQQVVVTYVNESPSSIGLTSRDLLLLSWDHFAHRWVSVFDAAKNGVNGTAKATDAILPSTDEISNLSYHRLRVGPRRTDLAIWADRSAGANGSLVVAIVHFDGQTSSVAWEKTFDPAGRTPEVIGRAPHQRLSIKAGWLTIDDPQCCAIRSYSETVGLKFSSESHGRRYGGYEVLASTKSWLGAYVAVPTGSGLSTQHPVVIHVITGSPATGVLQPGDELLSVAGVTVPSTSDLAPPIIDEIASQKPKAAVALTILRDDVQQVVNVTLSSAAQEQTATFTFAMPSPGYLGVGVTTLTSVVEQQYSVSTGGVYITNVETGSPATLGGLAEGDVITSVGSTATGSLTQFQAAVLATPPGTTVQVGYSDSTGVAQAVILTIGSYPSTMVTPIVAMV